MVYEGEDSDDSSVKVSPGKIQRTGVETVTVGRHSVTRTIQAPGVVRLDERRVVVVAPKLRPKTGPWLRRGPDLTPKTPSLSRFRHRKRSIKGH